MSFPCISIFCSSLLYWCVLSCSFRILALFPYNAFIPQINQCMHHYILLRHVSIKCKKWEWKKNRKIWHSSNARIWNYEMEIGESNSFRSRRSTFNGVICTHTHIHAEREGAKDYVPRYGYRMNNSKNKNCDKFYFVLVECRLGAARNDQNKNTNSEVTKPGQVARGMCKIIRRLPFPRNLWTIN